MQKFLLFIFLYFFGGASLQAQFVIKGAVLDKGKINLVENVKVFSTGGQSTITDSMGRYAIAVLPNDSIYFVYNNKPTQKFPVSKVSNPGVFDVSLHVYVSSKYSMLKEVIVYSKSHRQDSLENRQSYDDIFEYKKPGISTSVGADGTVGADVNELINLFRFKRNKRLKAFQNRLEIQEQEKYINYRFSKIFVGRITGLQSPALDSFVKWYRPDYAFAATADEMVFNQYILNAYYQFQKLGFVPAAKREE